MLSPEQVLMDGNRQGVPFPPPCPTEAVEGVKWWGRGAGTESSPDGLSRPWTQH